jgi:hypothetical protein
MDKHRIFFFTFGIANAGLFLYGILALVNPGVLVHSFSLYVYQFPDEAFEAVNYLAALYRLLGFFNLLLGGLSFVLLWQFRISRQTWILLTIMITSLLSYLGPIMFDNISGHIGTFEIIEHILFIAMILSGIIMMRGQESV